MTIPRLELQAAVSASRLKTTIVEELELNIDRVHLWSDYVTVLKYIRNENVNFGQFIMHRANKIRNNSNTQDWQFIPTELNVVDHCRRVIMHNTLTNKHRLIAVPAFLFQQNIDVEIDVEIEIISQDVNSQNNVHITLYSRETNILNQQPEKQFHCSTRVNWEYYSSFNEVVRHIAWLIKLKRNWVASKYNLNKPNFKLFIFDELQESESIILKLFQNKSYHQETGILQKHGTIHRSLQIIALDPIFKGNLLRVGGRLKSTNLALKCHSQIIIDKGHPLTPLIVKHFHKTNLHCGRGQALSSMRQRFWTPSNNVVIANVEELNHDNLLCPIYPLTN